MGFFQNLKEDLSEAMNELIHSDEEDDLVEETKDEADSVSVGEDIQTPPVVSDEELNNDDVAALLASLSGALEEEEEVVEKPEEPIIEDPELELSGLMEQVKEASAQSEALIREAEEEEKNKRLKSKSAFEAFMKSAPFGEEPEADEVQETPVLEEEPAEPKKETIAEALKHKNDPKPVKKEPEKEPELPSLLDEEPAEEAQDTISDEPNTDEMEKEAAKMLASFAAQESEGSMLDDEPQAAEESEEPVKDAVTETEEMAQDALEVPEMEIPPEPVAEEETEEVVESSDAEVDDVEPQSVLEEVSSEIVEENTLEEEGNVSEATTEISESEAQDIISENEEADENAASVTLEDLKEMPEKEESSSPEPYLSKAMVELPLELGIKTDETAIIAKGMVIRGDVHSNGNLDVFGELLGDVSCLGKLNLTGRINGNIKAGEVFADGAEIQGLVNSEGTLKVGQSSVIIGDCYGSRAVIAGAIKGNIDVHGPVVLDSSAIIMGDIKSQSVQINNGAVIEGKCSQCYAEVSPTSFFNDVK